MKSANIKNIRLAQILKIRLKNMHLRAAFFAPTSFLHASSSATTLVADMFIPADASVIPNVYTDITSENSPIASSPIVFDINMLKNIFTTWNNTELTNRIIVFNRNVFSVFNRSLPFYGQFWVGSFFALVKICARSLGKKKNRPFFAHINNI